jgi:thioredoxin 1
MANANLIELTSANWEQEVTRSEMPVFVDFWATWCGPCRLLAKTLGQLAQDYAGQIKVGSVNIEEAPELATQYRVSGLPQTLVFKGGNQEIMRAPGNLPMAELVSMVKRAQGAPAATPAAPPQA